MFCNSSPSWFLYPSLSASDLAFSSMFLPGLCNSSSCLKTQEPGRWVEKLFKVLLLLLDQKTGERHGWQFLVPARFLTIAWSHHTLPLMAAPPFLLSKHKQNNLHLWLLAVPPFCWNCPYCIVFFVWLYFVPPICLSLPHSSLIPALAPVCICSPHLIFFLLPPSASLPFFFTLSSVILISLSPEMCLFSLSFTPCLSGRQLSSSRTGFT